LSAALAAAITLTSSPREQPVSLDLPTPFPRYIVIEGPIGVGKTTLVEKLARRMEARVVLEIFEENPFLASFYKDRARFAFQTEMFFLLSRYQQQESFAQTDLFSRMTLSDYLFVKCRLFAGLTLTDHELSLYDRIYTILTAQVAQPDLVIYLHAPLETLLGRIQRRGRSYEQDMDPDYLDRLRSLYHNFFSHYEGSPLLAVDTSEVNFADDPSAVDELIKQIHQTYARVKAPRAAIEF
jgi:deoxyguanosine kinase